MLEEIKKIKEGRAGEIEALYQEQMDKGYYSSRDELELITIHSGEEISFEVKEKVPLCFPY